MNRRTTSILFVARVIIVFASFVGFSSVGFGPSPARAGAVLDADGDLIPDDFDNCSTLDNGPNDVSNQVDVDLDGYGNRCDADFDQDGATTPADFGIFLGTFGGPCVPPGACTPDLDGDGAVTPADFGIFLTYFGGGPPGPSGLACADPTIQTSLGDVPCLP